MNNEEFLNANINKYESLRSFKIQSGILIYKEDQITYTLPIPHINLKNLDSLYPNIFLLNAIDIFNLLYMLELFYKPVLTEYDYNIINQYVTNYLNINKLYTEGNAEYEFLNMKLGIPIDLSYNDSFSSLPISIAIKNYIDNYSHDIESGNSKGIKLVRTNTKGSTDFDYEDENIDNLNYYQDLTKTGFITFLFIAGTVIATCLYIIFVIYKQ